MTTAMMGTGTMMGFDAYLKDDHGNVVAPPPDGDWSDWVSAGKTRNYCNGETLCDWLDLYGEAKGFVPDEKLPGWNEYLDWTRFIFSQGHKFEDAVRRLLDERIGVYRVADPSVEHGWEVVRSLEAARQTFGAMCRAEPIISQGVLWNPTNETYGAADLLIRSDILHELFPDAIHEDEVDLGAPGIGLIRRHYRVVDVKFKNLELLKDGHAGAGLKDYMVQVHVYNEALGRIQGMTPGAAYLLGRSWKQNGDRSDNCLDRLAVCRMNHEISKLPISALASEAVAWVRRVRREGANWTPAPVPTVPELWPGGDGGGWSNAYREIQQATQDVIAMWQVGPGKRPIAHANGIFRWTDESFSPDKVGVTGVNAGTLARMREINLSTDGDPMAPARVTHAVEEWGTPRGVEFYVDFEWTGDINDDFSRMPRKGGDDVIFMIGCGHIEDGKWQFRCFIADDLSDAAEARVIDEWFAHMQAVTGRLAPGVDPLVFHWSYAEKTTLDEAYNSARNRHPEKDWPRPNWYDFLNKVMKQEPVVVRGAMAFGLKAIAKAMHQHGLIQTHWGDSVVDGMGAMVGAWRCAEEATAQGCRLEDIPLMGEIAAYNEVDCKVMMEIIGVLRERVARS
jgi:hypothetical protein